jgi:hypothetical protein
MPETPQQKKYLKKIFDKAFAFNLQEGMSEKKAEDDAYQGVYVTDKKAILSEMKHKKSSELSMFQDENYNDWKIGIFKNKNNTYSWSASSDSDDLGNPSKEFKTPKEAFANAENDVDEYIYNEEYSKDKNSLAKGAKIEMEHTKNYAVAEQIASDHLKENPDYYKYSGGKGKEYLVTCKDCQRSGMTQEKWQQELAIAKHTAKMSSSRRSTKRNRRINRFGKVY